MRPAERDLLFETAALVHLPSVFRVACILGGSEAEAEDLTQETYLRAYEKFGSFREGTNCRAWLLTILRHIAVDRHRASRGTPAPLPSEDDLPADGDAGPTSDAPPNIENEETFFDLFGDEVHRMLQRLPREGRVALVLCDVEGHSYEDIASILDCPVGTVRSRIHRARARLRERLRDYARSLGYLKEPRP
jgi:RNA polymerase sigma-70 factor (ECF subfamily)